MFLNRCRYAFCCTFQLSDTHHRFYHSARCNMSHKTPKKHVCELGQFPNDSHLEFCDVKAYTKRWEKHVAEKQAFRYIHSQRKSQNLQSGNRAGHIIWSDEKLGEPGNIVPYESDCRRGRECPSMRHKSSVPNQSRTIYRVRKTFCMICPLSNAFFNMLLQVQLGWSFVAQPFTINVRKDPGILGSYPQGLLCEPKCARIRDCKKSKNNKHGLGEHCPKAWRFQRYQCPGRSYQYSFQQPCASCML